MAIPIVERLPLSFSGENNYNTSQVSSTIFSSVGFEINNISWTNRNYRRTNSSDIGRCSSVSVTEALTKFRDCYHARRYRNSRCRQWSSLTI